MGENFSKLRTMAGWKVILLMLATFIGFLFLYSLGQSVDIPDVIMGVQIPIFILMSALIVVLYGYLMKSLEGRWSQTLNFSRLIPELSKGLVIGIVYFLLVTFVMYLLGSYSIKDAVWQVDFLRMLALFLLVACREEVLFRGILFRFIEQRWNYAIALTISSLIFGIAHLFNDGATIWGSLAIVVEAGLLLGVAYQKSGNLWLPIGIHWAWNVMEGPVLGFAVSGTNSSSIIHPVISGSELITGGVFGAEASIIALFWGVILTLLIAYFPSNKS